jgi:hypothetical protein
LRANSTAQRPITKRARGEKMYTKKQKQNNDDDDNNNNNNNNNNNGNNNNNSILIYLRANSTAQGPITE